MRSSNTSKIQHKDWLLSNPLKQWMEKDRKRSGILVASFLGISAYTVYLWLKGAGFPGNRHMTMLAKLTENDKISDEWSEWMDIMKNGDVEL